MRIFVLFIFTTILLFSNSISAVNEGSFNYLSLGYGICNLQELGYKNEYDQYTMKKPRAKPIYSLSFGRDINNFRFEGEFLHNRQSLDYSASDAYSVIMSNITMVHNSYFFNAFYNFKDLSSSITPYFGIGIGLSRNLVSDQNWKEVGVYPFELKNIDNNTIKHETIKGTKKTSFAFNISIGLRLELRNDLALNLSYKYLNLGNIKGSRQIIYPIDKIDSFYNVKGTIASHCMLIGLVFKF